MKGESAKLHDVREEFIAQWGVMGTQWGINRTMAQIHALLITSADPLSTDEVMEALTISRGNAHTNLKELVSWGLLRIVTRKGERKEFFEAEKDVWEIFRRIVEQRKRRELDPALLVVALARAESVIPYGPPWAVSQRELGVLEEAGLERVSLDTHSGGLWSEYVGVYQRPGDVGD